MTRIMLAAAVVAGAAIADLRAVPAAEAPWCAVISTGVEAVYWDCQYATLDACIPQVIAGSRGSCSPNPSYQGSASPKKKRTRSGQSEPR